MELTASPSKKCVTRKTDELARQLDESPYAAAKEKFLDKYGYRDVQFWDLTTESKN